MEASNINENTNLADYLLAITSAKL